MKLKTIFLLGYLVLGLVAVILGGTGIYFIERLANTPDRILKDNYGSILAAQNMIDELDNMDNAFIIIIAGKKERRYADSLFTKSSGGFLKNLALCEGNITEPGERELVQILHHIAVDYIALYNSGKERITGISDYDTIVAPSYTKVKTACYDLLNLNHTGMILRRDATVKISQSAELYMFIVSIISLLIVIIAIIKMPSLVINPISEFTRKVEAIAERKYSERIQNVAGNELGKLAVSFNIMAEKLEEYDKSNLEKIIAEKKRTEAIVKSMIDGIIVLDENNRVILVNNIGVELIGTGESELQGRDIVELAEKNNLISSITKDFAAEEKERSKLNYLRIVFRDKEEFFLKEIVRVQDDSNNLLGSIIILKNVTGFKELDELKSGFVATVSHEIRTPLSAMNMSLRLLQDERIGELNDEQMRITNSMKEEVKRLLKLVGELLDLSKIESGGDILKFQNVRAEELIDAAVTPMLMQFEQKNIDVHTDIEPNLPGLMLDANKIAWVLINLLNNAVRYSRNGSSIDIKVTKDPGRVIFSVKDHGAGIEPQYLGRIFDKFVQVSSGNIESSGRGVGLGLAISKEFVNAHGGDIWVKSELGKGSEFFFSIPA